MGYPDPLFINYSVGLSQVHKILLESSHCIGHDQAQDRAFRLGQLRDVHVYRLLGAGTLEELVYSRQLYKQQQSNLAVHGTRERRYFEGIQGVRGQASDLTCKIGVH